MTPHNIICVIRSLIALEMKPQAYTGRPETSPTQSSMQHIELGIHFSVPKKSVGSSAGYETQPLLQLKRCGICMRPGTGL